MNKTIKFMLFFLVIILIVGFIGVNNIAPYAILKPTKASGNIKPSDLNLESENLILETAKNVTLKGYWIKPKTDSIRGAVILLHGVGGCKESYLGLSQKLASMGIASVAFDGRAHGESGGEYCTYGYHEKSDISKIVDWIKAKYPDMKVGIWGNSLGGAIGIQALEQDKRLEFGVIESTFADLGQIVFDYKKRFLNGFGIKMLSDYTLKRAGEIGGFKPEKIKPSEAVKNIEQPMFLAHGDADANISYKYGQLLFKNLKSTDKEFFLVKGGEHWGLFETGGKEYERKLFGFIERNF